ncbi:MAG: ArsA-related P-loop ATPase [Myxococcota bacterium]
MSNLLQGLLERRLLLVTGKGGTGKTTFAATLGTLAARRGLETVVVEVGTDAQIPPLLSRGAPPKPNGRAPVQVAPHLHVFRVDPSEALTEYLELQVPFRPVVGMVTRNTGFRRLLDAAPGWRELITLGKIWHLETRSVGGSPRWDLLVVDAPATGQGLSFLSVPRVVLETVRIGPLRRHTRWVQDLLTDPRRTLVIPVTLPEELPVRETLELCGAVRALGLATGPIIANGVEPGPDLTDAEDILERVRSLPPSEPPGRLPPASLARCLEHALRRAELHAHFLRELRQSEKAPVLELPSLPGGVTGPAQVEELEAALERAFATPATR